MLLLATHSSQVASPWLGGGTSEWQGPDAAESRRGGNSRASLLWMCCWWWWWWRWFGLCACFQCAITCERRRSVGVCERLLTAAWQGQKAACIYHWMGIVLLSDPSISMRHAMCNNPHTIIRRNKHKTWSESVQESTMWLPYDNADNTGFFVSIAPLMWAWMGVLYWCCCCCYCCCCLVVIGVVVAGWLLLLLLAEWQNNIATSTTFSFFNVRLTMMLKITRTATTIGWIIN